MCYVINQDYDNDGTIDVDDAQGAAIVKTSISNQLYIGFDEMFKIPAMAQNVLNAAKAKPKQKE